MYSEKKIKFEIKEDHKFEKIRDMFNRLNNLLEFNSNVYDYNIKRIEMF